MKRFFTTLLAALAMVAVALTSAFISMRLAIHGRETYVPTLTGLSVQDAAVAARRAGLTLTLENKFYAPETPAGQVLAQAPAPGTRVRREWAVRITESLGTQRVAVPNLTGESERAATVSIRRLSLEPGTVAHLPVPGEPGIVLAQTPPANAAAVTGPRVSLLIGDQAPPTGAAYVMPSLGGLTWSAASARARSIGLRLVPVAAPAAAPNSADQPTTAAVSAPVDSLSASETTVPDTPSGVLSAQTPPAGRRVLAGDIVHVAFKHPTATPATPDSPAAAPTP